VGEQVDEMSGLLERAVATLGPDQRNHGRVQDIRRALGHLRSSIPKPRLGCPKMRNPMGAGKFVIASGTVAAKAF